MFTNAVLVNTAFPKHRLQHDVGIAYGDDIPTVKRLMLDVVARVEGVPQDPPRTPSLSNSPRRA